MIRTVVGDERVGLAVDLELAASDAVCIATDRRAKAAELTQQYRDEFASPYAAASNFYITDVIDPADTRWMLALALRKTLGKRELRPAKKHGNMPL